MSRSLNDLSPAFKPMAIELLARCTEARIPVVIVYTLRTPAEQAVLIAQRRSWTAHSRHLTGDAIDICPYQMYQLQGANKLLWNAADPIWQKIGAIGEGLGLVWGGRWTQRDMGHFERHISTLPIAPGSAITPPTPV